MRLLILLTALALSGCVSLEYTDPSGRRLKYTSPAFGTKHIKSLTLADGSRLEGYSNEQSQMVDFLRQIYEAGMATALKSTSK